MIDLSLRHRSPNDGNVAYGMGNKSTDGTTYLFRTFSDIYMSSVFSSKTPDVSKDINKYINKDIDLKII